jgi:hypothetical protein
MSAFACLGPRKESHCLLWPLIVQSLIAFLSAPVKIPQAGSDPVNGCSDPCMTN